MINPTILLKKAEQLVPTKVNKKGFRPRHSIALDDNEELFLNIVINADKGKFYRIKFYNTSDPGVIFIKHKGYILEAVKKYPVK